MLERRLYFYLDWALIVAIGALCAVGLAMIYSTTGGPGRIYWTQVYAVRLGVLAMAASANNSKPGLAGAKVDNFMLIDQQGIGHQLYYYKSNPAVVIVSHQAGDKASTKAIEAIEKMRWCRGSMRGLVKHKP